MNPQPILIFGLVLAALLYAGAGFLYHRKGLSTKMWYTTIGVSLAVLLGFALVGVFGVLSQGTTATIATIAAALTLVSALRWQPRTG